MGVVLDEDGAFSNWALQTRTAITNRHRSRELYAKSEAVELNRAPKLEAKSFLNSR